VFDLIGKHKYDANVPDMVSGEAVRRPLPTRLPCLALAVAHCVVGCGVSSQLSGLANPVTELPWHDKAWAEGLATKLSGSGSMRQSPAIGVVTHYVYRTFMHPSELPKAWAALVAMAADLQARNRPATAALVSTQAEP
jgi:hypothetical protein